MKTVLLSFFVLIVAAVVASPLVAQVIGDEAELARLEARAEEAIANGDADGASLTIGKAALMAGDLARRHGDSDQGRLFRATEALLRTQEHAYRALALFHRAGGQPPASSGVCGSLAQAHQALAHVQEFLSNPPPSSLSRVSRLETGAKDWTGTLTGLAQDFQCP
jgi:hypothetical protein